MGDDADAAPKYVYVGERAPGAMKSISAGEPPKVATEEVELLGEREGEGEATFPSGDTYKGSYIAGSRGGIGTYTYAAPPPEEGEEPKPPVAVYAGKWKDGVKSGVGKLTFATGDKYHGHFSDGKYSGQGTFYYANGDIYTGEWEEGKKKGLGTYIYKASGAKVSGTFEENVLLEGTFTDKWGSKYTGMFAGDASGPGNYVAGGTFEMCSGATDVLPKPTKAELIKEIEGYDADGNGFIDAAELKAILTRPGTGMVAMSLPEAEMFLELLTELFDKNSDGKLSVAEVATAIGDQYANI